MSDQQPLRWTDAKPTVPGWYFLRYEPGTCVDVVRLWIRESDRVLWCNSYAPVCEMRAQWAGPIQEPI